MDIKIGEQAVRIARKAIDEWVRKKKRIRPEGLPKAFDEEKGVFVTIKTYPEMELRGCIGFVEPGFPLSDGIVETAIFATRDPRFPELRKKELEHIIVEASILTKPKPIDCKREELPERIIIGRDGLIVRRGFNNGLLLPQVAVEHRMDAKSFLSSACIKAGIEPDAWKDKNTEIYSFRAEVFSEDSPHGRIIRKGN